LELPVAAAADAPPQPVAVPTVAEAAPASVETAAPVATVAEGDAGFWRGLSLALGGGWLLTLLLMLMRRSSRARGEKPAQPSEPQPSLKQARRLIDKALKAEDDAALRQALLQWGQLLWPQQRLDNLEQLAALCGQGLAESLEALNRSRFSREGGAWDAQALRSAIEQLEREHGGKAKEGLPPLYPT
ncbi:MAG: hypothetical protein OET90_03515, partial [Desulfuromonadales bacterium]|nr:hypothetical protein [Desulfuromonadales bacterium]